MTFGKRLAEERKKLGFNQTDFAKIGGITKTSQVNYEQSERSPNVDYWQAIATAGADVNYILTGKRTEKTQAERLNEKMVQLFEGLDAEQQKEILSVVHEKKRLNQCLSELDELKRKRG